MRISLIDSYDRLVGQQIQGLGWVGFALRLAHPVSVLHRVRAELVDQYGVMDRAERVFPIPDRRPLDYEFALWYSPSISVRTNTELMRQFHKFSVTATHNTWAIFATPELAEAGVRNAARFNLRSHIYTTRIVYGARGKVESLEEPVPGELAQDGRRRCVFSEALLGQYRVPAGHLLKTALEARYAPLGYSLGDENAVGFKGQDFCFCKGCLRSFRQFAKKMYGTPQAANAEWGTDYKSWDEVRPVSLLASQRRGRYSQWVDHRLHMETGFAEVHRRWIDALREVDPHARVGFDGPYPDSSFIGYDWYLLLPHFSLFNNYLGLPRQRLFMRAFMPRRGAYTGIWGHAGIHEPWEMLFDGMTSYWLWHAWRYFDYDLKPTEAMRKLDPQIGELRRGIGRLLIASDLQHDPIALHYSTPCIHATTIAFKETTWHDSVDDFFYALRDSGYEPTAISRQQIEAGELTPDRIRVLVLPYSMAMSDKEVQKVKEFVRAGGMLLADFSPAIMDEHCKPHDESVLLEVFGKFKPLHVQRYGSGTAIYLGDLVQRYAKLRQQHEGLGKRRGLMRILRDAARVPTYARIVDDNGVEPEGLSSSFCARFKRGSATYLGLLPRTRSPLNGFLELSTKRHVYEVRSGQYLGHTNRPALRFEEMQPMVVALLPAKAERLSLEVDRQRYRPGEAVAYHIKLHTSGTEPLPCTFHVEFLGPDGQLVPWATRNMTCDDESAEGVLPLALNERPGGYEIRARDVASGLYTSVTLEVEGGGR